MYYESEKNSFSINILPTNCSRVEVRAAVGLSAVREKETFSLRSLVVACVTFFHAGDVVFNFIDWFWLYDGV